jgi:hypothetical protein
MHIRQYTKHSFWHSTINDNSVVLQKKELSEKFVKMRSAPQATLY